MSRLLINERPLQVIPSLAKAIGLNEAIMLQQLHYWLGEAGKDRDGKRWIYNTYEDWHEQFPFWSVRTVRRVIGNLEERGLIESTSEYNKMPSDHTKWYSIDYDALNDVETGAPGQSVHPTSGQTVHMVNHRGHRENGQSSAFAVYEENIGPLTPIIADKLGACIDQSGETWTQQAIEISAEQNKRSIAYIEGILRRCHAEGKPPKAATEAKSDPFPNGDPLDYVKGLDEDLARIANE